jgi:ferric-dicitrate binding protein FerR (iron transport regulator)
VTRDAERPDAEELAVLRWVGRAPEAAPSPEARERARAAFLTGDAAGVPAVRARPGTLRRVLPLAIAAAAAGLVFYGAQPADRWVVESVTGTATFDGTAAHDGDEYAEGMVTTGPGASLEAELGHRLRVFVAGDSRLELPRGPSRWFPSRRTVDVDRGVFFASTAGRPLGFGMRVRTDEAAIDVVGTTFAVRRNDLGTCVCLYEGRVAIRGTTAGDVEVAAGQRALLPPGSPSPVVEPLDEMETTLLGGLEGRQAQVTSP